MESEAFCNGLAMGIALYQQRIIAAHDQKGHLKIGEKLYYVQDGRERLTEMLDRILE